METLVLEEAQLGEEAAAITLVLHNKKDIDVFPVLVLI